MDDRSEPKTSWTAYSEGERSISELNVYEFNSRLPGSLARHGYNLLQLDDDPGYQLVTDEHYRTATAEQDHRNN